MKENKYKGETFSFWQLLKKYKIEIPIIQRDYAQGRKDKQEIRDNFLNALSNSINESKPIKLDFIYGSNKEKTFQPLDGQQRLTTLFLVHWYALINQQGANEESINTLSKFTYETRISSREFCEALIRNPINVSAADSEIRPIIINSSWFILSWEKDPTIDAMLRTIDHIHKKFSAIENLWSKLTSDECLVSFYHVELENIGLTDDLYIKMNARGKLLSPFENFKASFQKYVSDNKWDTKEDFLETFACKIDTKWTDLFWTHRKGNSIDEAFMRFTSTIAMIRKSIERTDDRIEIISALQEKPNSVKSEYFSEIGFKYLAECFDIYSRIVSDNIDLPFNFPLWQHSPLNNLFSALVYEDNSSSNLQRNSASYSQKVLFYAQTEYLRKINNFNLVNFQEWMRVIRNIVSRGDVTKYGDRPTIIRSPQTFDGVINLVTELSEGCENIYEYLTKKVNFKSAFAKDQIEEEKIKAKLISANRENQKVIFDLENSNLLRGRIEFALYCIDFKNDFGNFNLPLFISVQEVFRKYFDEEKEILNSLRRALLTIEDNGKYDYYGYWWSFWNVVGANKRCLIDKYREIEYYIYSPYQIYFKKLVLRLVENNFEEIVNNFIAPPDFPNWKTRLIREPVLLDTMCKSKYIAIPPDESCCYLLKSMRPRDIDGCDLII